MVLSYSAVAQPTASTPQVISIASSSTAAVPKTNPVEQETPSPSTTTSSGQPVAGPSSSSSSSSSQTQIKHLILDAGPLLSLTPLRHLAGSFHTTPSVLAELRDPKARQHWENLALTGVDVRVEPPSAEAMAKVVAFAKKTGDFAVLSQTDLSVIALTYQYEAMVNGEDNIRTEPGQRKGKGPEKAVEACKDTAEIPSAAAEDDDEEGEEEGSAEANEETGDDGDVVVEVPEITQYIEQIMLDSSTSADSNDHDGEDAARFSTDPSTKATKETTKYDPTETRTEPEPAPTAQDEDEDSESDGGEWINPSNLKTHRSRDLGLSTPDGSAKVPPPDVACMTGDYAVQNVLLGMGLGLVGEGGKRISKVKSWVLRCHACFKICKDPSKRFCPSCGNPSLLRTSVSTNAKTGAQTIHLKKNYQYHLRGSKYSIPEPKMGRAKGQQKGGSGLILREDQREWSDAVRSAEIKRGKEERRAAKGALEGWNDPDWLPEIITVGMSGKGRSHTGGMPTIGHGRKNPNQARRKK